MEDEESLKNKKAAEDKANGGDGPIPYPRGEDKAEPEAAETPADDK